MAQNVVKAKSRTRAKFTNRKGLAAKVAQVEKTQMGRDIGTFNPGDTVKVHVRIKEGDKERIQLFEGTVIAMGNRGASRSFTVRKIAHGVGCERVFLMTSPTVQKVEVASPGKVRRAKLYYLRAREGKAARIERDMDATNAASGAKA